MLKHCKHFLILLTLNILAFLPCVNAQFYIEKLDEKINTEEFDELGPALDVSGQTMYFTRVASPDFIQKFGDNLESKNDTTLANIFSEIAGKQIDDISTSDYNQDIWVATLSGQGMTENLRHPDYPVNNVYPNSVCSTYPEENAIIVINQFPVDGNILEGFSKILITEEEEYQQPIPLSIFDYEDTGTSVNLCMSQDGQHLFISLKREDSQGHNDIYVSLKIAKNLWSKPERIEGINSEFNESSPFITPDKKVLYFSSNRPGGIGKHDLYFCNRLDYSYKKWSEPQILEYPINTEHDEFLAFLTQNEKYLYFSSNRDGSSDIFRVDLERPKFLPEDLTIKLKIINAETLEITRGEIQWKTKYEDDFEGFFRTYSGEFDMTLRKNQPYLFQVDKRGFTSEQVEIDPWSLVSQSITQKEIEIYVHPGKKIKEKKEYPFPFGKQRRFTLDEIYFQKGSDIVQPKSIPEIDRLFKVLDEHKNISIQIEGHTDNVGDKQALIDLSLKRAKAIGAYLVAKGIDKKRIKVKGYGDTLALNANTTEQEREKNRRVGIRIIKE